MVDTSMLTIPLIIVGVLIAVMLVVLMMLRESQQPPAQQLPRARTAAEQILIDRFARGEISRTDFEARRHLLEAHDPTHRPHGLHRPPAGRHP